MKRSFLFFLMTLISFSLLAQIGDIEYNTGTSDENLMSQNFSPVVPEVSQSMASNIMNRTDLYTGIHSVSIPIYTFKSKKVSIPISITRSIPNKTRGLKDGSIGFGWNLSTDFKVVRKINGKPDESYGGYFESYNKILNVNTISASTFDEGINNKWDVSPDKFYFNLNGISGFFMFDHNKEIHIDCEQPIKVVALFSGDTRDIMGFKITDTNGYIYTFGIDDKAIGEVASKTGIGRVNTLPKGMLYTIQTDGDLKVFNFIPDEYFYCAELGQYINFNPYQANYVGGYYPLEFDYSLNITALYQDVKFEENPVNMEWKITRIETPDRDDFISFSYDNGGWVEYEDTPTNLNYSYSLSEVNYPGVKAIILNPNWSYPMTLENQYIEIWVPGKYFVGRKEKWENIPGLSSGIVENAAYEAPIINSTYYSTIYKKESSLIKVANRYGEYLDLNFSEDGLDDVQPSTRYGSSYSPKLLDNISLHKSNGFKEKTIANFSYTKDNYNNHLTTLHTFGKLYQFEGLKYFDKIIYPTGGYKTYEFDDETNLFTARLNSEKEYLSDQTLVKNISYKYYDQVFYGYGNTIYNKIPYKTSLYLDETNVAIYGLSNLVIKKNTPFYNSDFSSKGSKAVYKKVETYLNNSLIKTDMFTNTFVTHGTKYYLQDQLFVEPPENFSIYGYSVIPGITYRSSDQATSYTIEKDYNNGLLEKEIIVGQGDISERVTDNIYDNNDKSGLWAVRLFNYFENGRGRFYKREKIFFPEKESIFTSTKTTFEDSHEITENKEFYFDNNLLTKTISFDSDGNTIMNQVRYPSDFFDGSTSYVPGAENDHIKAVALMAYRNMIATPIYQASFIKYTDDDEDDPFSMLSAKLNRFKIGEIDYDIINEPAILIENINVAEYGKPHKYFTPYDIIHPLSGGYFEYIDPSFNTKLNLKYDDDVFTNNHNIVQKEMPDGTPVSYVWAYNDRFIVGELKGVTYQQIIDDLANVFYFDISQINNSTDNNYIESKMDQLRGYYNTRDVQVISYTHDPFRGLISKTNERGEKITYHYDDEFRLEYIKDDDGKIISKNQYHFKNQ